MFYLFCCYLSSWHVILFCSFCLACVLSGVFAYLVVHCL